MKRYSRTLDNLILAALASREGNFEEAALRLQTAAEDENFDEDVELLSDENEEALEEDASLSELAEADEKDVEVSEEEEVSDEESLAAAIARVADKRRGRGRKVAKAATEEEEMEEEEMEEESSEEETAKAKKRLERQQANLARFKK